MSLRLAPRWHAGRDGRHVGEGLGDQPTGAARREAGPARQGEAEAGDDAVTQAPQLRDQVRAGLCDRGQCAQ
jgi:hypothetical protein